MGRGRAKAKQAKVARALKYSGANTDLTQLQAELSANRSDYPDYADAADGFDDEFDDDFDDEDDEDDED
jgi:Protein of unknown function (DUF3073)